MDDKNAKLNKKTRPRVIRVTLITLGLVFLLYLLSEGLAYRLLRTHAISNETFIAAYSPVLSLTRRHERCEDLIGWYERLWYNEGRAIADEIRGEMSKAGYKVVE